MNPEKHFDAVPDSFTKESHLTQVNSIVKGGGIILDDLKEVEVALRIYNGEIGGVMPTSGLSTNVNMVKNMGQNAGGYGIALALLAADKMQQGRDIVGTIIAETNLATRGSYSRHFDYDGMGSNFLKTSVTINKVKGKFLLQISAAYVGDKPEYDLAAMLGRPCAVSSVKIELSLSVVDDYWYNVNLSSILAPVTSIDPDHKMSWERLANQLADRNSDSSYHIVRCKDNLAFALNIGMDQPLHRNSDDKIVTLVKASGGNLAGAAWNAYSDEHEAQEQKLYLWLSLAEGGGSGLAVSAKERQTLLDLTKEIEDLLIAQVK